MAGFADVLRCPDCLEELRYLKEPKELPCGHVYCLPCLQTYARRPEVRPAVKSESSDTADNGDSVQEVIKCSICSTSHTIDGVTSLPDYSAAASGDNNHENGDTTDEPTAKKQRVNCDKCKGDAKAAECYCVDCDRKLCQRHEELHQEFFCEPDQPHQIINIHSYLEKPDLYIKPMCELHNKEYAFSCRKCLCLKCQQCAVEGKCEGYVDHFFKSLKDINSQLQEEYEELMKQCSKQSAELCKSEKGIWQMMDGIDGQCDESITEVNESYNKAVASLEKERDTVLQKIELYRERKKSEGEEFYMNLRAQREELDDLRASQDSFLRNSHTVRIIEEHKNRLATFKKALAGTESLELNLDDYDPIVENTNYLYGLNLSPVPDYLSEVATVSTGYKTHSVHIAVQGDILASTDMGLQQYSLFKNKNWPHQRHPVTSSCKLSFYGPPGFGRGEIAFVKKDGPNTRAVYELQQRGKNVELFNFQFPGTQACCIDSADDGSMAATGDSSIVLYNYKTRGGGKKTEHKLDYQPTYLSFLSNLHLVVTDQENNKVHMYSLSRPGELKLVWTCTDVPAPDGVCTTPVGYILVRGKNDQHLYILSDQGALVSTLQYTFPSKGGGAMSLHIDRLAAVNNEKDEFSLYRIKTSNLHTNLRYNHLHGNCMPQRRPRNQ